MALQFHGNGTALRGPLVVVILLAVSLALVTAYSREGEGGPVHAAQNAVSGISAPLNFVGAAVGSAGDSAATAVTDLTADAGTLSGLREQNEQLRGMVSQLEEYRQEAQRLQGLLDMRDQYDLASVSARVVGRSSDAWNEMVTIDKGSEDGVLAGLPVMSGTGLVGQVVSTTAHTADVRLLSDQQSGVSVLVQSNRAEGIVSGSLEGLLYLEDLPEGTQVQAGDVVVTSGLGGSFFRGIIVGEVVSVEQQPGDTQPVIVVRPNADVSSFEEVLVVTGVGNTSAADSAGTPSGADEGSSSEGSSAGSDGGGSSSNEGSSSDGADGEGSSADGTEGAQGGDAQ